MNGSQHDNQPSLCRNGCGFYGYALLFYFYFRGRGHICGDTGRGDGSFRCVRALSRFIVVAFSSGLCALLLT